MNIAMSTINATNVESVGSGFVLNTEVEKFAPVLLLREKILLQAKACVESIIAANAKLRKKNKYKNKKSKRYHLRQKPLANILHSTCRWSIDLHYLQSD